MTAREEYDAMRRLFALRRISGVPDVQSLDECIRYLQLMLELKLITKEELSARLTDVEKCLGRAKKNGG